ncbi:MAG: sugar phosphate isomerase/epimerase [Planctomycetota bacterium]|nr:sugar phosphate isomerase/epimerase [Planctomycetota bacterium]
MKFAICNETFGDWPIEQGFEAARKFNYTGIEVAPFTLGNSVYEITTQQRREYVECAKKHGLEIVGLHWLLAKTNGMHLTVGDAEVQNRTLDYLIALVQLCSDLGGKIMVLGSPMQRNFPATMTHATAMDNAAKLLSQVVPALEKHDVRLAIEPLGPQEGNFLNHASQARELIEKIGSPNVKLHLDVKAMSSEGTPIDSIIRDHADIMIHFHANDPNRLGPGMGDVDQRPIFKALKQVNYAGWVSVEVFDYSPGVDRILGESMANMLAVCE